MNGAEIKKHVGAVHVRGALSLLERKVSNVLLLNAYDELDDPSVAEHSINLPILADVVGFDSKDSKLLKNALRSLVDYKIEWDVLGEGDDEGEWGVSSFLASARVERRTGVCTYSYPAPLRRRLANPQIYARINLSVQTRFASSYALALYENCVRFRKVGSTGFLALDTWRGLLGVEDGEYEEYKYLNKRVFKPAVAGVNEHSDIRVEMVTRKEGRRVVAVKFLVAEAPGGLGGGTSEMAEALGTAVLPDPRELAPEPAELLAPVQMKLVEFGLSEAQALDLSTEFDADRVGRNLGYVEAKLAAGDDIKNLAAYTVAAVRSDYERGDRSARKKRGEAKAKGAKAAEQQALFPSPAVVAVRSLGDEDDAENRQLDAAVAALSDADRAVLDAEAVALLRASGSGWWREIEGAVEVGETDGLGIAVRSVLQVARRDVMREREA
ncbi:replication initiation protein [Rubricoccus marinus]|uniref:Initiator Rep protein WH1 domain-containing protein n=1 Tax=Rubricoccus marinus TaxID=716817 RepID=A0A259TUE9_9BACT|nr:replication initiation protein [Rubricoccus marinus]OZC01247.1 hypothetical protein BSZ36_18530 [Rubricoccus marinus]